MLAEKDPSVYGDYVANLDFPPFVLPTQDN